jgi:protease IV
MEWVIICRSLETQMQQSNPASTSASEQSHLSANGWERELLTRLAVAALKEQRRARRWSLFFRFLILAYASALLALYLPDDIVLSGKAKPHTALVDVQGVISEDGEASADRIIEGLRAAFADDDTAGVIVRINSPGGSPVQAAYINEEIKRLRSLHPDIPLHAVVTDMCASGGYYVAAAADKIFVNKSSVIGSIGVLMNAFGFVGIMEKLGIERRLLTAGEHKGLLDPFSPMRIDEVQHVEAILKELHSQFIDVVKDGRGARLTGGEELFSGLIWSGEKSMELGLADAVGGAHYVAREVIGAEELVDFTPKHDYLDRFAKRIGVVMAQLLPTYASVSSMQLR